MTLKAKGNIIDLSSPKVMGILNITPDSFYEGSRYALNDAVKTAGEMLSAGAAIIDIGGMSSRPGAQIPDAAEELSRVLPVVEALISTYPGMIISIDTMRASVASACLEVGASIINDISGGIFDSEIIEVAAQKNAPYIAMHMRGTPETMQQNTNYEDVVLELLKYFSERIHYYHSRGLYDVIIDPGIGFSKTIQQNFTIIKNLSAIRILKKPILIGVSRKSVIYKTLNLSPEDALNGTTVLHTIALMGGANILRVHDVKEATEAVRLVGEINAI
jgi:dihydropteroate synthase